MDSVFTGVLDHKIVNLLVELDWVLSLMARPAEHKGKFGVVFADTHLHHILCLQKVKLFQRLFEMVDSAEELGCNSNIFKGVVCVERVTCLIRFQLNTRLNGYLVVAAFGFLGYLNLEHIVANGILQIQLVIVFDHAFHNVFQLGKRQAEFNQNVICALLNSICFIFDIFRIQQLNLVTALLEKVLPNHATRHDKSRVGRRFQHNSIIVSLQNHILKKVGKNIMIRQKLRKKWDKNLHWIFLWHWLEIWHFQDRS